MIRFGEDEAHIRTIVEKNDKEYRIDMHLKKNKTKGIAINGLPIRRASELFGIVNVVFFSPEDLNIIKNEEQTLMAELVFLVFYDGSDFQRGLPSLVDCVS